MKFRHKDLSKRFIGLTSEEFDQFLKSEGYTYFIEYDENNNKEIISHTYNIKTTSNSCIKIVEFKRTKNDLFMISNQTDYNDMVSFEDWLKVVMAAAAERHTDIKISYGTKLYSVVNI